MQQFAGRGADVPAGAANALSPVPSAVFLLMASAPEVSGAGRAAVGVQWRQDNVGNDASSSTAFPVCENFNMGAKSCASIAARVFADLP